MLLSSRNIARPTLATAVLTRGYSLKSFLKYRFIIRRNWSLSRVLLSERGRVKFDHFVFHEGNIGSIAQVAISVASWPLRLKFVSVEPFFEAFKQERNPAYSQRCPETELSAQFSVEYRAMCAFWTDEFLSYLRDYDVIFRIDEDCVLNRVNFETVVAPLVEGSLDYCAGMAFGLDSEDVTRGLVAFVAQWHDQHPGTSKPVLNRNPYTNLFLLAPRAVKSNPEALDFLESVRRSGCILNNRWGDHVIWGALLSMYRDTMRSDLEADVSYFHGSHASQVSQGQKIKKLSLGSFGKAALRRLFVRNTG